MPTLYCTSSDGTRIAYDVTGTGATVILLHGAGKDRRDWHNLGYVSTLQSQFRVITADLRGAGESDHPTHISDYSLDKLCGDVSCIADSCQARQFALCGYDLGGSIARYMAARSDRVSALIVMGVPFGPAVRTSFARKIDELVQFQNSHQAREASPDPLLEGIEDKDMNVWLACFQAMRSYPVVQPADIHCPALLLAGSENSDTVNWVNSHRTTLQNAGTRVEIIDGLDHRGELTDIARVLPAINAFLLSIQASEAIAS